MCYNIRVNIMKIFRFLAGILASGAVFYSAFLPLLSLGDLASRNFSQLIAPISPPNFNLNFFDFPAQYIIFAVSILFLVSTFLRKKIFATLGIFIAFLFLAFLESQGNLQVFGYGTLLFATGVILEMVLVFLPNSKPKKT